MASSRVSETAFRQLFVVIILAFAGYKAFYADLALAHCICRVHDSGVAAMIGVAEIGGARATECPRFISLLLTLGSPPKIE